jgi:hypothetical protein
VATIEVGAREELDRPVRWGIGADAVQSMQMSLARQVATRRGSALSPKPDQVLQRAARDWNAKCLEPRMRLRMRIRLRRIRIPGHAANRHCPLGHPRACR